MPVNNNDLNLTQMLKEILDSNTLSNIDNNLQARNLDANQTNKDVQATLREGIEENVTSLNNLDLTQMLKEILDSNTLSNVDNNLQARNLDANQINKDVQATLREGEGSDQNVTSLNNLDLTQMLKEILNSNALLNVDNNLLARNLDANQTNKDLQATLRETNNADAQNVNTSDYTTLLSRIIDRNENLKDVLANLRESNDTTAEVKTEDEGDPLAPKLSIELEPALIVNNVTVNEGSPYVVFTVSGASNQLASLSLSDGTTGSTMGSNALEYWDGSTWTNYTSGNVNLNTNGKLLVRTTLSPEQETAQDNGETFILNATNTSGTAGTGTATIHDDGTGTYFPDNNPTGDTPTTTTPVLDDDRPLSVNDIDVNEGSPYVVFTVSGASNQLASLSLSDGTTGSTMGSNALEYWDGSTWTNYTSGNVNLNTNGKLLVRTTLSPEQETAQDNGETFILNATNTSGTAGTGTATIHDDGTGTYFPDNNPTGDTPTTTTPVLDDDRPLSVNDIDVNEGSPYVVFTVSGASNQLASLSLSDGTTGSTMGSNALEYWDGSTWTNYTSGNVNLNTNGKLLVRTTLSPEQETAQDNGETFILNATNTSGTAGTGTATIHDDGTGTYFPDNNPTGDTPTTTTPVLDDDRPLSVNDIDVNEGSPYVVFTVSGASNQLASLSLSDGTTGSTMGSNALEYWDGSTWTNYTSGNVNLNTNGKLLVRTTLSPEQETAQDNGETFILNATNTSGTAGTGTATIHDDGTGTYFPDNNPTGDTPTTTTPVLDDDRPLSVNDIDVNEGSPYVVFTVSGASNQLASLSLSDGTTGSTMGSNALEYWDGSTWTNYTSGNVNLNTNGKLLVRTTLSPEQETAQDNGETFILNATNTSGTAGTGTATIHDDGTGTYFPDNNPTGDTPTTTTPVLDDDRPLSVNDIDVNEGSPYVVFTVSGASNQLASLSLSDGTTGSTMGSNALEYWDGSTWTNYTSGNVNLNTNGKLLVRTTLSPEQETAQDNGETFILNATNTSGTAGTGTATIHDDGTGTYFPDNNPTGDTPTTTTPVLDDDRPLSVNDIDVNEGSPYAIFTVTGNEGQYVKLEYTDNTASGGTTTPIDGSVDYDSNLFYFDGIAWQGYTPGSYVQIPIGGNTLLVGTNIVNDTLYEGDHTYILTATNTSGSTNVITSNNEGIATIKDDGTGQWFDGSSEIGSNTAPSGNTLDDDRPVISINDVSVTEGNYAQFTISLSKSVGENITFDLSSTDGTAIGGSTNPSPTDGSEDYTPTYQVSIDNGVTWSSNVSSATISANSTSILVRIPTINDTQSEADESFDLNISNISGPVKNASASGTATIVDDDNTNTTPTSSDKTVSTNEDTPYVLQTSDFTFTDSDVGDSLTKIKITTLETKGALQYSSDGITWTDVTLNQEISVSDITAGKLRYNPVANESGNNYTTFNFIVNDGITYSSTPNIITVNVTPVNDAPVLDLDANNSTTTGSDYLTSYALGKKGISIGDTDVSITDIDDTNIESATITLTNAQTGDLLFAKDLPSGITASSYNSGTGVITLTGSATLADYEKAIESINFYNSNTGANTTDRTIEVTVNDGTDDSNTATTIKVATNALSIITDPTVYEGESAIFSVSLSDTRSVSTKVYLTTDGTSTVTADYNSQLMYESSPGTWVNVLNDSGGDYITIPIGETSVDIKIKTVAEAVPDDGESLILTGTISGDSTNMANTVASTSTIITELASLEISSPSYTIEGNSAVFEVSLSQVKASSTTIDLEISGDVTSSDYTAFEYSTDGISWSTIFGNQITLAANSSIPPSMFVRVTTASADGSDNLESLVLNATTSDSDISSYGNSVSANTIILEPLSLTVTEEKDGVATLNTSVTTSVDANYTYVKSSDGQNGAVVDNGDGTLTYTPNTDFSGADSFSYLMIDKTTGETITSVANVTVDAVADTPDVSISASEVVSVNVIDSTAWYFIDTQGSVGVTEDVSGGASVDTSTTFAIGKGDFVYQTFDSSLTGFYDINATFTDCSLTIYVGNSSGTNIINIVSKGAITSGSASSIDMTGYDTIIVSNANSKAGTIDSFDTSASIATGTVKYDVTIDNSLTDYSNASSGTTNVEELQDVTVIVRDNTNTVIDSSSLFNQGTYNVADGSWSFTQAQLNGLQITISSTQSTNGITIESTATSMELSNSSTATNSAIVTIISTNDTPTIGDQSMQVINGNANTNGSNIDTYYSTDGGNIFSWDPSKTQIPELYANAQKVDITFDNVNGTVTGTIDNGATQIFQTTINMADSNGTTINYTQGTELLGVVNMIDGDILLPGGGNNDYRIFQFTDADGSSNVVVDALVAAHNLIEDSAADLSDSDSEHTVNTNNYYIGVDSNNMNAGQQLVFDFNTVDTYDGITTQSNEISEVNIKLFNFGSEKSGDELFITVITTSGREQILLTQDSDYTTELEYTVRSSNGDPIIGVEFLAGNESSFKLGIASIGSINYNDTFEMNLAYDITDTDGDTDLGTSTIQVGSGTVNTSLNYEIDSKIVYDSSDVTINGGTGTDTLSLDSGVSIDFASYTNDINNIEKIDMTNSSATNTLSNIKMQDILDITDSNDLLTILGDSGDSVSLKSESGNDWTQGTTVDGYTTYVNDANGGTEVSLKIDSDVSVSIV